jgi:hypothetical protein
LPFKKAEFEQVVAQYLAGTLGDVNGVVKLPASLASTTSGGVVYATRRPEWGAILLFVTWRGKGSNLRGYIYCDRFKSASPPKSLELVGPVIPPTPEGELVDVAVGEAVGNGWYRTSRDVD